jgi:fibronectin-binding autotransporter adhesin
MQINKVNKTVWYWTMLMTFSLASVHAATVTNADVPDNLNLGTSWVGGTAPGSADVALWDHTVQVNTNKSLGANLAWAGIQILDPAGPITIAADGNTLTNGASGIDMSLATNGLSLANPVVLGANQTWQVTNGVTLTVSGVVSGSKLLTLNNGGNNTGAIILSGANTYTGGTIINSGIAQINTINAFGTASVTNNGGILELTNFPSAGVMVNAFNVTGTSLIDMAGKSSSFVLDGAWSGNGTVLVTNDTASGSTLTLGGASGGNMANFTGSIIVVTNASGTPSAGTIRFNNGGSLVNAGNAGMSVNLGTNSTVKIINRDGGTTSIGELTGGPGTQIAGPTGGAGTEIWSIGGKNTSVTFAGNFINNAANEFAALTKVGTGTFTLTGTNSGNGTTGPTGPVTISAGTLQIGDGNADGTLLSGAIANSAALVFNRPDAYNVSNNITGGGSITIQGGGTETYSGTNSSSGTTTISQGDLVLALSGLMSCPIFVASGATFDISQDPTFTLNQALSGSGTVTGLVTAVVGSISPGGTGAAGTLTFLSGLTESGNINNKIELSTPSGTNDSINIVGDLTLNGTNIITLSDFNGGSIPSGTYTIMTYSGNFNGGLTNLSVNAIGVIGTLTNPPGQIAIIISPGARGATNLTWVGDGVANNWDTTSTNWISGATTFVFQNGDGVLFNNVGATNNTVNLPVSVSPASVLVNSTSNYILTGVSGITGATSLIKTNSGTLTISATNSYTGPTIVGGGVLEVLNIANGNLPSALGAANGNATNLVFYNGTSFKYSSVDQPSMDRNVTLNSGNVTINIANSAANVTENGSLVGSATLTKFGPGTLTLAAPNTYNGGTVISNGVLALGSNTANNNGVGGSGVGATNLPVTFYGGTLQLFGYNGSNGNNYNTFYNPLVVPAGQSGTLQIFPRGAVNTGGSAGLFSSLSGAGTLNLVVNFVRDALSGDWSAFTGLINVTNRNASGDEMRINNNFGYSNAAIYLNGTLIMDSSLSSGATINIGELGGVSMATIGAGNSSQPNPTWVVGWKNTTNTFAGTIANDGVTSITKVGTGKWILTGNNTYTGSTTISNGVLALSDGVTDSAIGGSTNINITSSGILDVSLALGTYTSGNVPRTIDVGSSQTLSGNGTVNGSVHLFGTLSPFIATNVFGTFTITSNLLVDSGAIVNFNLDNTNGFSPVSDKIVCPTNTINAGAVLNVNQVSTNDLHTGDVFHLFSTAVIFSDPSGVASVTINAPTTSQSGTNYGWDFSQLAINGTIVLTNGVPISTSPPAAAFSGTPTNIFVTQSVTFTDASTGSITNWVWSFGDGVSVTNGSNVSVSHAYNAVGTDTVSLTVSGPGGSNTSSKPGYIVVKARVAIGRPVLSGGNFILSGTNGPAGQTYRILSSTNVALPVINWTPVYTNVFAADGSYTYTNTPLTNKATFFKLVSP